MSPYRSYNPFRCRLNRRLRRSLRQLFRCQESRFRQRCDSDSLSRPLSPCRCGRRLTRRKSEFPSRGRERQRRFQPSSAARSLHSRRSQYRSSCPCRRRSREVLSDRKPSRFRSGRDRDRVRRSSKLCTSRRRRPSSNCIRSSSSRDRAETCFQSVCSRRRSSRDNASRLPCRSPCRRSNRRMSRRRKRCRSLSECRFLLYRRFRNCSRRPSCEFRRRGCELLRHLRCSHGRVPFRS